MSKKAFTLVEIMVAIVITTIVLTAAFTIWSRIRLRISRSYTKQTLQNELRKIANYMQNDFKSIRYYRDGDESKPIELPNNNTNWTLSFQKFKEIDESSKDKLAQDILEEVKYSLNNKVLKRNNKLLSANCESVQIIRATEEKSNIYEDKRLEEARDSKLEIEITGVLRVPGTTEEEYHVEKTSVVMRNEYYTKINKNYKSNFDLQKMGNVVVEADLGKIDLASQSNEALKEMLATLEQTMIKCNENLDNINSAMGDEEPEGVHWWEKLGAWLGADNLYGEFKNERNKLVAADTIDEVNKAVEDIQKKVDEDEEKFFKNSYSGYDKLTNEEKKEFKKAYDMKVHDKNMEDAYKKLNNGKEPITNEKILNAQANGNKLDENGKETTILDGGGDSSIVEQKKQEANNILSYYNNISLDWMDKSEYKEIIGTYQSRKNLLESANTKIELIKVKDECNRDKNEVEKELASRK